MGPICSRFAERVDASARHDHTGAPAGSWTVEAAMEARKRPSGGGSGCAARQASSAGWRSKLRRRCVHRPAAPRCAAEQAKVLENTTQRSEVNMGKIRRARKGRSQYEGTQRKHIASGQSASRKASCPLAKLSKARTRPCNRSSARSSSVKRSAAGMRSPSRSLARSSVANKASSS